MTRDILSAISIIVVSALAGCSVPGGFSPVWRHSDEAFSYPNSIDVCEASDLVIAGAGRFQLLLQEPAPGQLLVLKYGTGERVDTGSFGVDGVSGVACCESRDGHRLVVASFDGQFAVGKLAGDAEMDRLVLDGAVTDLAVDCARGIALLAVRRTENESAVLEVASVDLADLGVTQAEVTRVEYEYPLMIRKIAINPREGQVALGLGDGSVQLWDYVREERVQVVRPPVSEFDQITDLEFASTRPLLFIGITTMNWPPSPGGPREVHKLEVYDWSRQAYAPTAFVDQRIMDSEWVPWAQSLAVANGRAVQLFDPARQEFRTVIEAGDWVDAIAATRDGIITVDGKGEIVRWKSSR